MLLITISVYIYYHCIRVMELNILCILKLLNQRNKLCQNLYEVFYILCPFNLLPLFPQLILGFDSSNRVVSLQTDEDRTDLYLARRSKHFFQRRLTEKIIV